MDHANVGKEKVADRADVSEKQVDLSFFDCHVFERVASYQSIRKGRSGRPWRWQVLQMENREYMNNRRKKICWKLYRKCKKECAVGTQHHQLCNGK